MAKRSCILFFCILLILTGAAGAATVINGRCELRGIDLFAKPVALSGTWDAYSNLLVSPDDFASVKLPAPTRILLEPRSRHLKLITENASKKIFATYRTLIQTAFTDNDMLELVFDTDCANIVIYVNGVKIAQRGAMPTSVAVAKNWEYLPMAATFFPDSAGKVDLVIQTFAESSGKLCAPEIWVANTSEYVKYLDNMISDFIVFFFVIVSVQILVGYLFYPGNRALIFLPGVFLALAVQQVIDRQDIWAGLLAGISTFALYKLGIIATSVAQICINHYLYCIDNNFFRAKLLFGIDVGFITITACGVYFPTLTLYANQAVLVLALLCIFYSVCVITRRFVCVAENRIGVAMLLPIQLTIAVYWVHKIMLAIGTDIGFAANAALLIYALCITISLGYYLAYDKKLRKSVEIVSLQNEAAFLRAQIRPHFLNNALNSVAALCRIDGKLAAEALARLAEFLQSSFRFDHKKVYVTVEEELILVRAYIDLERERFGERLHYNEEVQVDALDKLILPFSIQPLVENAVIHGVGNNPDGGDVSVIIQFSKKRIVVVVRDSGKGFDKLKFMSENQNGIGLDNVRTRLKMHFDSELLVDCSANGTVVSFGVPNINYRG